MEYIELGKEKYEKKFQNDATSLYTKDFFFEAGRILLQLAKRHQTAFMIAVIEIDDFKEMQEKYGKHAAYKVLVLTAKIIGNKFRDSDVVADMEDGQIGVIFYDTNNVNSRIAFEALRKKIEESTYMLNGENIDVTVSVGGTVMQNLMSARTIDVLYEQAKKSVEIAIKKGKNCVVLY